MLSDANTWLPVLLLGVLLLVMVVLLVRLSLLRRETRSVLRRQEELTGFVERSLQALDARQTTREQYAQQATIEALRDVQMNSAARVDALGARFDQHASGQEERLRHVTDVLNQRLSANDLKLERMRETLFGTLSDIRKDTGLKLDEMRKTVDENLHTTLNKRLGESFSLVNERLEQVYKGLGEMRSLAVGVGDLKKVLTNVKTRGVWGEVQLGALLAEMLSERQYVANAAVRPDTQERVEYAIRLPGRDTDAPVLLPIDAKFPVESYERLVLALETGEREPAENARAAFLSALRKEAARISSKYIAPPYTTDFAVMFLPIEGLYAEALRLPGLAGDMQRDYRVVIAGPTTFSALINSLQMGFRTMAIEQRSAEVWQLLGSVKNEFADFAQLLDKTRQRLKQAADSIDSAARKSSSIQRRLRTVENVDTPLLDDEDTDALDIPDDLNTMEEDV
ncbi:MAG TPA: DNA recombination protein RmuC [Clostridiales bacterium]|nr:DNA recombination protein RmuC [Clostridiales bacterium]